MGRYRLTADRWRLLDAYLAGHGVRFGAPTRAQTTGGKHAPNSYHYEGLARDYGIRNSDLRGVLNALIPLASGPNCAVVELFGLDVYRRNGAPIMPSTTLWKAHQNHVHAALRAGATLPAVPDQKGALMADNPDLPNMEGPMSFHVVFDQAGIVRGYYIFSTATGELHTHGEVPYLGRSEDTTPG